jgi:hypothetical protein
MNRQITKAEAKAFQKRWSAINAGEIKELRSTTISRKFRQLAVLMLAAKKLRWPRALAEEEQVRDRWKRLRKGFSLRAQDPGREAFCRGSGPTAARGWERGEEK